MTPEPQKKSTVSTQHMHPALKDIYRRFAFIYGQQSAGECLDHFRKILDKYSVTLDRERQAGEIWSEQDALLITYGDSIIKEGNSRPKLKVLHTFLKEYLNDTFNRLHILPFFPYSTDSGFSVIDYKTVREDLGNWQDIEGLASEYRLMADLVINHISRESEWFQNYKKQKQPGKDYFMEVESGSDLSKVTRPRNSPILTEVDTSKGKRKVWTTFSEDQIDLDFSNPAVLFELIDIFLFYLSKGIKIIRLDAIAYLWKKIGSTSIHRPETHEIVKLFRDIVDYVHPSVTLITETNVPFEENISYFGDGDEAHMVYQFSLPPLLLHAILSENPQYLRRWAVNLPAPPKGCTYFNFTSSHDGIGVRPLEGLVPQEEFQWLVEGVKEREGYVSYKENADGTESPYELNITYFDAFSDPETANNELQYRRYMCSQLIMMSLQGLPAFYIHNVTATGNDLEGVQKTNEKRAINRKQWEYGELVEHLENEDHMTHRVFYRIKELISIRKQHPAFSPLAGQQVLDKENGLFILLRSAIDRSEEVLVVSNVTGVSRELDREDVKPLTDLQMDVTDLITGSEFRKGAEIQLDPYQTLWLRL